MDHEAGDVEDVEFTYEGTWTHWLCPACQTIMQVEEDVQNGAALDCDGCGASGVAVRNV
jgi:predicted RNA-binding Zn-ribbon protein involved in translation (DUF1610 family)